MARKKTTKNADPAAEYIDSAGVKLNAASDLIIEAKKTGEVISARNLINGVEYVGGGSGGNMLIDGIIDFDNMSITINNSFNDIETALNSGRNVIIKINRPAQAGITHIIYALVTDLQSSSNIYVAYAISAAKPIFGTETEISTYEFAAASPDDNLICRIS